MTRTVTFGPFRLLPEQRMLLEDDRHLRLGSRALDILIALVERAGEVVSKDELVARVWPDTFVEEANLRVHIGALRKVLGDGRDGARYVTNIPGRGYCFVATVENLKDEPLVAAPHSRVEPVNRLPAPLTRMIGREEAVAALVGQLPARRFVTIAGPGGIGKTTVALAVAEKLVGRYEHGVRFVDLALLSDPALVSSALASACGISIYADDPLPGLLAFLGSRQALIVLDNCEHVVEAAAAVVEQVLRGAPFVNIMATSREPLRSAGEWVHRLPSLASPPTGVLTAVEALSYPAVQLFAERSMSSSDQFTLADAEAAAVADLCRRLDGIPLAIELAAATVDLFGVRGLCARLDDRLSLLTRGRRTALPRHQTLRAMLDWSHEILAERERVILRRVAVFAGGFSLESAAAIAVDEVIGSRDIFDGITNLAAKSLLVADVSGEVVRYRLLETMRNYALEKLRASNDGTEVFHRHARRCCGLLQEAEADWEARPVREWLALYGGQIDDVRVALDWAFSPDGDAAQGVALAAAAIPLWMHLSLMQECRGWAARALAAGPLPDARHRMQLHAALGLALMYTKGAASDTGAALTQALQAAEQLNDPDYQLRALWGLCVDRLNNGIFREALMFAHRLHDVAAGSGRETDLPIADRMIGFSLHYLGEENEARKHLERMLLRYPTRARRSHIVRFQFDLRVTAQLVLAEVLWIQGNADQAIDMVGRGIDEAMSLEHTLSLCNALAKACPVVLLAGDLATAERFVTLLLEHATRSALLSWQAEARCFLGVLRIRRGDLASGSDALRRSLAELSDISFSLRCSALLGELADACARTGQMPRAIAAIDEALARAERHHEYWCYPELLRVKGEVTLREGGFNAEVRAEQLFRTAMDRARGQGALAWELRAATSLGQLHSSRNRPEQARELLAPVYSRFREGLRTADLVRAEALLREVEAQQVLC